MRFEFAFLYKEHIQVNQGLFILHIDYLYLQNTKSYKTCDFDLIQLLRYKLGLLNPTVNKVPEIGNISDLTFFGHSDLPFLLIIRLDFLNRIKNIKKEDQARNECPSPSLASPAMSSDNQLWIIKKSYCDLEGHFKKVVHFDRLMVSPGYCQYIALKKPMVILMVSQIDYQKMVSMSFLKKFRNIFNRVFVNGFQTLGRKCHSNQSREYISEIKIIFVILISIGI
jgi:hypothetical protein